MTPVQEVESNGTMEHFTCHDIKAVLSGLLDGELDPETRHLAERHLLSCPACREEVQAAEDADAMVRAAAIDDERAWTPELEQRMFAAVTGSASGAPAVGASTIAGATESADGTRRLRLAAWSGWSVAAAAALVAGVTLLGNGLGSSSSPTGNTNPDSDWIVHGDVSTTEESATATATGTQDADTSTSNEGFAATDETEFLSADEVIEFAQNRTTSASSANGRSVDQPAVENDSRFEISPAEFAQVNFGSVWTDVDSAKVTAAGADSSNDESTGDPWWADALIAVDSGREQVGRVGTWLSDALANGFGSSSAMAGPVTPMSFDALRSVTEPHDFATADTLFRQAAFPDQFSLSGSSNLMSSRNSRSRDTSDTDARQSARPANDRSHSAGTSSASSRDMTAVKSPAASNDVPIDLADHVYNASILLSLIEMADAETMADVQQIYRVLKVDGHCSAG
ncbi:MAG: anti-sigma factor family protein [Planctomycetota bacterium]